MSDEDFKTVGELFDEATKATRPAFCEKHGEYQSRNILGNGKIWLPCPECGREKEEARKKDAKEREGREAMQKWLRRLNKSAIPERFRDRTIDNFICKNKGQEEALKFAKKYAEDFIGDALNGRSAIFLGKVGTGKTHLAIGIALYGMKALKSAYFTTVQKIMRDIKATYSKECEFTENDVIDTLLFPDLLILDEVGVQFGTDFERNVMFDVINGRYEARKSTILLSNLSTDDIKKFLGERVFDRLREDGGKVVPFDWDSYRSSL